MVLLQAPVAVSQVLTVPDATTRARGGQRAKRQVEETHAWKDWMSREVTRVERPGRRNDEGKPVHARTAAIAATTNDGQTSRIRAMSG